MRSSDEPADRRHVRTVWTPEADGGSVLHVLGRHKRDGDETVRYLCGDVAVGALLGVRPRDDEFVLADPAWTR